MRTYSELIKLSTFEERFDYLKLDGKIGEDTFGFERYLNQVLYHLPEWKETRRKVLVRDEGCDLAIPDREIYGRAIVHHMNPITIEDVEEHNPDIFDPEFLITVSKLTHDAIHFGDPSILIESEPIVRQPDDTCPWR